jgi:amino acid adenylation domain-containing protein
LEECIHRRFEQQAVLTPDSVALEFGNRRMSYRELDVRANRVASALRYAGIVPGFVVAVMAPRGIETIVGLLGILKAGAAYLALDPAHPSERHRLMLEDSSSCALLTSGKLSSDMSFFSGPVLDIASVSNMESLPSSNPSSATSRDSLAYICYTSGSTGKPKGAEIPHRGVIRLVCDPDYVAIAPSDVFLQLATVAFDASTFEIWGPLLNGAKLVIFPPEVPTPRDLAECLEQKQVTIVFLTTALFNLMVDHECAALARVKQVLSGGENISKEHVKKFLEHLQDQNVFIHCYGPTENTTFTTCLRLDRSAVVGEVVPIGFPIKGTQVYILDESGKRVALGCEGELFAGGDGVARGYINRPELTAASFVPNPFNLDSSERLYRTGDRAMWGSDDSVIFLGRKDNQVKVRGFRIELGEIEAALQTDESISQAVVVLKDAGHGAGLLVAYIVATMHHLVPAPAELRRHLARTLPAHMIPSRYVVVKALPLTSNGKIDRAALPAPESLSPSHGEHEQHPRNTLENEIQQVWRGVFRHPEIGIRDNFLDLGGNSLIAAEIALQMENVLQRRLPIGVFMTAQTIEELATLLSKDSNGAAYLRSHIVRLPTRGRGPAIFALHNLSGTAYLHLGLTRYLPSEMSIFGVQALGKDGEYFMPASLEAMAMKYADEICEVQPDGPYHLLGYSLGGWLAYAVAGELKRRGKQLGVIALLDTTDPARIRFHLKVTSALVWFHERLMTHCRQMSCLPAAKAGGYALGRIRALVNHLRQKCGKRKAMVQPDDLFGLHMMKLARSYRPPRFDISVHFFTLAATPRCGSVIWKFYARRGCTTHGVFTFHNDYWKGVRMSAFTKRFIEVMEKHDGHCSTTSIRDVNYC